MFHRILTVLFVAALLAGPALPDGHDLGGEAAMAAMADGMDGEMPAAGGAGTVAAKVGDTAITVGHVLVAIDDVNPHQLQLPPDELFESLLERLIQQEQLAQQIGEISALTQLQMDNERRSLLATAVVERMLGAIIITEADTRAAYQQRFGGFEPDTEYNAAHILVETEEEATAIAAELAGGADFGSLARSRSIGPSGPSGGNLGWFGAGRMVPEFEAAVKELQVGDISAPVKTQFGWHVIRLNESRTPNVPSYDDLKPQLEGEVLQTRFREVVGAALRNTPVERFDLGDVDPGAMIEQLNKADADE